MCEIEQIDEIKRKLDQARALAIQAGGGVLAYLLDIAILEAEDTKKTAEAAAKGSHKGEQEGF